MGLKSIVLSGALIVGSGALAGGAAQDYTEGRTLDGRLWYRYSVQKPGVHAVVAEVPAEGCSYRIMEFYRDGKSLGVAEDTCSDGILDRVFVSLRESTSSDMVVDVQGRVPKAPVVCVSGGEVVDGWMRECTAAEKALLDDLYCRLRQ